MVRMIFQTACILSAYLASFVGMGIALAADGADGYRSSCAQCHGMNLGGGTGPSLSGSKFEHDWYGKKNKFQQYISQTMPLGAAASLPQATYSAITAFIYSANNLDWQPPASTVVHVSSAARKFPESAHIVASATSSEPDAGELRDPDSRDWLFHNSSADGARHSELRQIDPANVSHLVPQCIFQTGEIGSFQASPVERHGKLYFTTAHRTYSIDASTCRLIWQHEYLPVGEERLPTNRGIALYRGMVIRGTLDGHLIALDAESGALLWDIPVCDSGTGCFISGVPVVYDNKIFVGEAGAEFGAVDHVHAFDADTLRLLWTFRTTPALVAAATSASGKTSDVRGGSVWSTITVDAVMGQLYVSVGNPGPDFDDSQRKGPNLFADSVVVLDAKTGKLIWYAQQIPHDTHDWDTAAAPVIYDLDHRQLVAVGSKDGHVYIYDRANHLELARAQVSRQLNVEHAFSTTVGTHFCPGTLGGVEWYGPAFEPTSKMLFVNSVDWCATVTLLSEPNPAIPWGAMAVQDPVKEARGSLTAIDALSGEQKWRFNADAPMLAAVTTTSAGLVLTGTGSGFFLAFDGRTGRELFRFFTGGAIAGGISTYEVASRQYVAVLSGNASKSVWQNTGAATVIVFALPSN